MRCNFYIALAFFAAQPAARADVVDVLWSSDGRFAHQSTVAPGKFAEVCGKLPVSASVRWEFDVSSPVDFNIHYHAGKDVVFPSKLSGVATANNILRARRARLLLDVEQQVGRTHLYEREAAARMTRAARTPELIIRGLTANPGAAGAWAVWQVNWRG